MFCSFEKRTDMRTEWLSCRPSFFLVQFSRLSSSIQNLEQNLTSVSLQSLKDVLCAPQGRIFRDGHLGETEKSQTSEKRCWFPVSLASHMQGTSVQKVYYKVGVNIRPPLHV